jgi:hypothetical protein
MSTQNVQKFSDAWAKAKSGVCELEPGGVYDVGAQPFKAIKGSGIFIGLADRFKDQAKPTLLFGAPYNGMPASFDPKKQGQAVRAALTLGADVTISRLNFRGSLAAQLLLATSGTVRLSMVTVAGAGLCTMGGADLLDVADVDGTAAANLIYVGHGAHNGLLRMRRVNLHGGMLNEHGLRTHQLDELDWVGGIFDGSGSMQGKDVLTIHELRVKGLIQDVHFKGWGTIGGLKPESPGAGNDRAVVKNLTLRNVTFEPCIRSSPDRKSKDFGKLNGSQLYVLAGVSGFVWDGGSTVASNGSCIRWSKDGASKWRSAPTGEIHNVAGVGGKRDAFAAGALAGLKFKSDGNTMNGKPI